MFKIWRRILTDITKGIKNASNTWWWRLKRTNNETINLYTLVHDHKWRERATEHSNITGGSVIRRSRSDMFGSAACFFISPTLLSSVISAPRVCHRCIPMRVLSPPQKTHFGPANWALFSLSYPETIKINCQGFFFDLHLIPFPPNVTTIDRKSLSWGEILRTRRM